MRIADVRVLEVEGEGPPWRFEDRAVEPLDLYPGEGPSAGARDVPAPIVARYVEILTDDGALGRYGPVDAHQASFVLSDLRPFLLGRDPLAGSAIHDLMLRLHRHGRAGAFVKAVSAVDDALWDLRGRVHGLPVYRLLGGPTRERIPAYASMLGHPTDPDRAARIAAEHAAEGFPAQKWFFAHGPSAGPEGLRRNLAMARAVREAVGPGYPLMFDAFMGWDLSYATEMLRGLEPIEPSWVEEPVPVERVEVLRRLAAATGVRLATGEHAHTRWQILELLLSRAVGVVQADPDWDGGITEHLHICSLCSAFDVPVIAHGHAMAPPVHIAAASSPQVVPMVEWLVRIQERNQWFHLRALRPERGEIPLPGEPGLGIDLDPAKVSARRVLRSSG